MPKRQNPEEKREGRKDNAAEDAAEKTKGTLKVPSKPKRK